MLAICRIHIQIKEEKSDLYICQFRKNNKKKKLLLLLRTLINKEQCFVFLPSESVWVTEFSSYKRKASSNLHLILSCLLYLSLSSFISRESERVFFLYFLTYANAYIYVCMIMTSSSEISLDRKRIGGNQNSDWNKFLKPSDECIFRSMYWIKSDSVLLFCEVNIEVFLIKHSTHLFHRSLSHLHTEVKKEGEKKRPRLTLSFLF